MPVRPVYRKRHPPPGARPGTLMIPADSPAPQIHVFEYLPETCLERDVERVDELAEVIDSDSRYWVDVQGLGDEEVLRGLATIFRLHVLTLEDVTNVPSRPKTEHHDGYQVFITRMVRFCPETTDLIVEQVGVLWGRNFVLTIQEKQGDVLETIRQRLREGTQRPIRMHGSDYLAYAIIDCIVDGFYPVVEGYAEWIEQLESEAVHRPVPGTLEEINILRRELASVRRAIAPQREAVAQLIKDSSPLISDEVRIFLRDTSDHCSQIADVVESYREFASGLLNTYLSCVGQRTNDIMKVLTIMASIFIPLTFMAGIYGMNFESMPELRVRWAYPALWCVMLATALGMILYFRRLGWIGNHTPHLNDDRSAESGE